MMPVLVIAGHRYPLIWLHLPAFVANDNRDWIA